MFLRTPHEKWYNLNERTGFLSMQLIPETCSGKNNPAFLGHRQQHLRCSASVSIEFTPEVENEKAGFLIFQNETHYYFLCKSLEENKPVVELYKSISGGESNNQMEIIASQNLSIEQSEKELYLKIAADGNIYSFYYASESNNWNLLKDNVDATFLSTKVAGGFVGCMFALYATSSGKKSVNKCYFDFFEYEGNDKIY